MSKTENPVLRIIPIGGLGEIGLNCMAFEYDDEIIVIDCGVMFSDLQVLGIEITLPDMTYLERNKNKIAAYLITHAHEDHIGALPYAIKNHPAPIYCTNFAQKLVESKMEEFELTRKCEFKNFKPGMECTFKHFKVRPAFVNHSIIEAMALFIDTPLGQIVFTGDFKIDKNPFYGKPFDETPFVEAGKKGVTLLMSDSTNVERDGHSLSESSIYGKLEELIKSPAGICVVAVFASNIARVGQILEIARKLGKKVALLGRSMDSNVKVAFELGYVKDLNEVLIPIEAIPHYHRAQVMILSTGSQGEYRSALSRIATNEHRDVKLQDGDLVIMSSKFIPGNEKAIGRMINNLFKLGCEVIYESVADVHVSGHANAGELRQMIDWCKPKYFIPVHGEYRHLVKHRKLALDSGIKLQNAPVVVNGEILELDGSGLAVVEKYDENRIQIDETGWNEIPRSVIKDRRKIAESGIVFCVIAMDKNQKKLLQPPEIITRGIFHDAEEDEDGEIIRESGITRSNKKVLVENEIVSRSKEVVLAIIKDCAEVSRERAVDMPEEVRVGLRRYFNNLIGKKPVVIPVLLSI